MTKTLKSKRKHLHLYDDRLINAIRYCWDKGIYAYPIVHQDGVKRKVPLVKIQMQIGRKKKIGDVVYDQKDDALYDKINEIYLHHYDKRND